MMSNLLFSATTSTSHIFCSSYFMLEFYYRYLCLVCPCYTFWVSVRPGGGISPLLIFPGFSHFVVLTFLTCGSGIEDWGYINNLDSRYMETWRWSKFSSGIRCHFFLKMHTFLWMPQLDPDPTTTTPISWSSQKASDIHIFPFCFAKSTAWHRLTNSQMWISLGPLSRQEMRTTVICQSK